MRRKKRRHERYVKKIWTEREEMHSKRRKIEEAGKEGKNKERRRNGGMKCLVIKEEYQYQCLDH
jgi:hypothetical protein